MRSHRKPPARAACLTCREAKIRCDGRQPCTRCSTRKLTCSYRPSRRGGVRRSRYSSELAAAQTSFLQQASPFIQASEHVRPGPTFPSNDQVSWTYDLESAINLLVPFRGIQNLDVQPNTIDLEISSHPLADNVEQGDFPLIRGYASDEEILEAYYIYIHQFLPLLPPPRSSQCHDTSFPIEPQTHPDGSPKTEFLPHWPSSSLTLAISAILALIPLSPGNHVCSGPSLSLRRSYAHLFAEAALNAADKELEEITRALSRPSGISGKIGNVDEHSRLFPILALCLLSIYEYCQRGSISRMRSRANQAVAAAMDLSLHSLGNASTEEERRTWWSAMIALYLSSIDQRTSPIISFSDPRITTHFPSFQGSSELWSMLLEAEQAFISVTHTFNDQINSSGIGALSSDTPEKILRLDTHLSDLAKKSSYIPKSVPGGPDSAASQNMRTISRLFIHCARIRLHRARAFMDIPIFLERYCDLTAIDDQNETNLPFLSLRTQDIA